MKLTFYCQSCSQKLNVGYSHIGTVVRCPACDMAQPVTTPLAKRYPSLRIAAVTLQVLGVVMATGLTVGVFVQMAKYELWSQAQLLKGLLVTTAGFSLAFASGILTYAAGEVIRLLADLEESVRSTRLHLELMRAEQRPPAPATEVPQQQSQ
jgi:hypothetical protein